MTGPNVLLTARGRGATVTDRASGTHALVRRLPLVAIVAAAPATTRTAPTAATTIPGPVVGIMTTPATSNTTPTTSNTTAALRTAFPFHHP